MSRTRRKTTPESQKYRKDQRAQEAHVAKAVREFKRLLKTLQPYVENAKAEHPGRDRTSRHKRARAFVKAVKDLPLVTGYLDTFIGTEVQHPQAGSWRQKVIYQARDVLTLGQTMKDALVEVGKQSFKGFQAIEIAGDQAPYREAIPTELRDFLPDNIVVKVDESGNIEHITDRFENEFETLGVKIKKMHALVRNYNNIAKQVKADLKSDDEVVKLSALITAIMMETGIRPGKKGNKANIRVNGEKVEVETFGAITLGPSHVNFVRENFVELAFVGKLGGRNFATISDGEIIQLLKTYMDQNKGSKYVMVTSGGRGVEYKDIGRYFDHRFKGVSPTDFRKLRATETILEALREEQVALYQRIQSFKEDASADLKSRVVGAVVETLNKALSLAQAALSHDKSNTTRKSYINPEIILGFLSTGRVEDTLEKAILQGKSTLSFDPEVFVNRATGKVGSSMPKSGTSLQDLLDSLEDELEDAGIETISKRVAQRHVLAQKVAARHLKRGRTWSSQGQLDEYLKTLKPENRDEARKNHTVEKGDGAKGKGESGGASPQHLKAAGVPEGTKLPSSTANAIKSESGQKAVAMVTTKAGNTLLAKKISDVKAPKVVTTLANSTIREVRNVAVNTPTILMDCIKDKRKPSKEKRKWPKGCDEPDSKVECSVGEASERDILYGSAVYAAGVTVALATAPASGAASAGIIGGKAFLNSLTLHIGIGAVSEAVDKGLLHLEVVQDVVTSVGGSLATAVGNWGTGVIPGLGTLMESVASAGSKALGMMAAEDVEGILQDADMVRLAKEGDKDKLHEKFVEKITAFSKAKLEKGLSDAEIKSILEHEG